MSQLLRDQLGDRDPRLTDWTSVMEWLERLGPDRMRDALPRELVDSAMHQVHVGHAGREWENEAGAGMEYKARVVVRIGAVVVYRQSERSSAAFESGTSRRFEHTSESVLVAVPPDAVIISPRSYEGDAGYFELCTPCAAYLTDVTNKDGPWWEVLLKELRPYLNEKRRYESAAAVEKERARVLIEGKEAERLQAAAEAVYAARPLQRESSAQTAAGHSPSQRVSSELRRNWGFAAAILLIAIVTIFAVLNI